MWYSWFLPLSAMFCALTSTNCATVVVFPATFGEPAYSMWKVTKVRKTLTPFCLHTRAFRSKLVLTTRPSSAKKTVFKVYRNRNRTCCPIASDKERLHWLKNAGFLHFKRLRAKCVPNLDAGSSQPPLLHGPPSHQLQPDRTCGW